MKVKKQAKNKRAKSHLIPLPHPSGTHTIDLDHMIKTLKIYRKALDTFEDDLKIFRRIDPELIVSDEHLCLILTYVNNTLAGIRQAAAEYKQAYQHNGLRPVWR